MMRVFSSRLQWDSQPNPLSILLAEKRRSGAAILDLTESNPTRAGLDYPGDELLAALADPRALRYDPDPRGLLAAREAVAEYYAQRGVDVPASRILLTASTSEAYSYLFKLLADPGDEILVPRPSYPLFDYLAAMESVRVIQYPLRYDGVWHIDFDALASAITPRTRAIVVVNPNNPTGSYLKRTEWERLQTFGLPILSDEVFSDFAFAPDPGASRDARRIERCAHVFDERALEDRRPPANEIGLDRRRRTGSRCRTRRFGVDRRHFLIRRHAGSMGAAPHPGGVRSRPGADPPADRGRTWNISGNAPPALTLPAAVSTPRAAGTPSSKCPASAPKRNGRSVFWPRATSWFNPASSTILNRKPFWC